MKETNKIVNLISLRVRSDVKQKKEDIKTKLYK